MKTRHVLASLLALTFIASSGATEPPALPARNPQLADSTYNIAHTTADFTVLPGPVGPGRRIRDDEYRWKPIGPINGYAALYSAPYPNGKRVVWVGGNDRVAKLDADSLAVLTTYAIGGNTYFGEEEIRRHIATMDAMDDDAVVKYGMKTTLAAFNNSGASCYRFLTRDNEFFVPYRSASGDVSIRVYGDSDPADPASTIQLRREWKIPTDISTAPLMGSNMTHDGRTILVTQDGVVFSIAHDFSAYTYVRLPHADATVATQDVFGSFVRNGVTVDDQGGVYIVTHDFMHRVQWTGTALSLDEADGAWQVPYDNGNVVGSGTTPSLMGWGLREDHLVVIADGAPSNHLMALWRDAIPTDWKGISGYPRRVAGIVPIRFGVSADEQVQIENAPVVYGYGAFVNNTFPEQRCAISADRRGSGWPNR